jgi:DNA excision repair protein ERCC-1
MSSSSSAVHKIQINPKQKGNPLIEHFKGNVAWEFNPNLVPDYLVGESSCCLFLSLKYHRLHPEYIRVRMRDLQGTIYKLKVLLLMVDVVRTCKVSG